MLALEVYKTLCSQKIRPRHVPGWSHVTLACPGEITVTGVFTNLCYFHKHNQTPIFTSSLSGFIRFICLMNFFVSGHSLDQEGKELYLVTALGSL